jgi:tetratricopeptide (TPR) repeat protein
MIEPGSSPQFDMSSPRSFLRSPAGSVAALALSVLIAVSLLAAAVPVRSARSPLYVIGWDGADWSLIDPLLAQGRLPNLAGLIARGRAARLARYEPIASPLIWTTLATMLTPLEHGVTDFVEYDEETHLVRPVSGLSRNGPALWNVASSRGLRVGVVGSWATWPAEQVNGFFVSDRAAPIVLDPELTRKSSALAFPESVADAVRRLAGREGLPTFSDVRRLLDVTSSEFEQTAAAGKGLADPIDGTRRILGSTRVYARTALEFAAREKPDLLMVYFSGTDEIGRLLARYHPPRRPTVTAEEFRRFSKGVGAFYEEIDRILGSFLEQADGRHADVLLVSDHGFKWGEDRPVVSDSQDVATASLWHAPQGVLVAAGPDVVRSAVRGTASVFDVAPIAARLLKLPRDPRGPGRVPKGWFSERLGAAPPPRRWDELTKVVRMATQMAPAAAARESRENIEKQKALGYLAGARSSSPAPASNGSSSVRRTAGGDNNPGLFERGRKRYEAARRFAMAAVAADPEVPEFGENLADVLELLGRFPEADAEAVAASKRRSAQTAPDAIIARAAERVREGRRDDALRLLTRAQGATPDPGHTIEDAYGRLALDAGRAADSRRVFQELTRLHPDEFKNWLMLARAARALGEWDESPRSLEHARALAPDHPAVLKELALQEKGSHVGNR